MKEFQKLKKKYALNNSYFKNRLPDAPANPFEVIDYFGQHGELPYENGQMTDNWFYDCFVEYQKRAGVFNSQFFTPTKTAEEIANILSLYANTDEEILEPCCGFGQITRQLINLGFSDIQAFDNDEKMINACKDLFQPDKSDYLDVYVHDYKNFDHFHMGHQYPFIVANPPYEVKELTSFLEYVREKLYSKGIAVLLIPSGFLDKTRPAKLVGIFYDFAILERRTMNESFARTGVNAEIVVLRKI